MSVFNCICGLELVSQHRLNLCTWASIHIGNEGKGIRPEMMQYITKAITIPRIGKAESLNAAVAAGIIVGQLVAGI